MPNSPNDARKFLESLQRYDLSLLLAQCKVELGEFEIDNGFYQDLVNQATVEAPTPIDEGLRQLPPQDRKRIAEAIATAYPNLRAPEDIVVHTSGDTAQVGAATMLAELVIHREMMIGVATGGPRIQDVDDYYRAREARIREGLPPGVRYENPHADLWAWYHHWSTRLPQYKERRFYIRQMFAPAIEEIAKRPSLPSEPREATGWARVDRALSKARAQFQTATAEEDCQAIGLICREVIISLAQAVYDPAIHETLDGVQPSDTDANRMLQAYIAHVFTGESNKEVRTHAKASLALAVHLQHRRTATRELAALCIEATASTTAVVSIIARTGEI